MALVKREYKGYFITNEGSYNMWVIKPMGRGTVKKELKGHFNKIEYAEFAIDGVVGKGDKDGKGKSTSRD